MTVFIYVTMFIFGLSDRVGVYPIMLTFLCDNVYLCDNFYLRSIQSCCGLSDRVDDLFDNVYLWNNVLRSIGSCYGLPNHVDGYM